jgi:SNF family Na+-dependent transporter
VFFLKERGQFNGKLEFILTVIGFSVGLGNVWRFPALVFDNGGGPFLVIFFLMLFLVGIPMFLLELSIGQFSGLGPSDVFYRMCPIFQGLGYAAVIINTFIGFYYNVIVAYCLYYLIVSLNSVLPWSTCDYSQTWVTNECQQRNQDVNCSSFLNYLNSNKLNISLIKSPSEEYFYNQVLKLSGNLGSMGALVWPSVLCLLSCWLIVFSALSKGIQSLGKVSYVTAIFPYIVLTILVITGCLLPGAGEGIKFYLGLGDFDWSKFIEPSVWRAATGQVFYALGTCMGGLIALASCNPFNNNLIRDTLLIPILDCMTGFYAGFAIFSVLGYMVKSKCVFEGGGDFSSVVAGGPELAFIVYPEGMSLIKAVPPLWSCLFFIMMLLLGFGSEFSIIETFFIMIMDIFKDLINTSLKKILVRFVFCMIFFLFGLCMTAEGGFYILIIINEYIGGYPLLTVGLLQVIVVPWFYGTQQLTKDIEAMVGEKPKWIWIALTISWKFICPFMLALILILTMAFPGGPLQVNGYVIPGYGLAVGWIIVSIPLLAILTCALVQVYFHRHNWKLLFKPHPLYYSRYNNLINEKKGIALRSGDNNRVYPLEIEQDTNYHF